MNLKSSTLTLALIASISTAASLTPSSSSSDPAHVDYDPVATWTAKFRNRPFRGMNQNTTSDQFFTNIKNTGIALDEETEEHWREWDPAVMVTTPDAINEIIFNGGEHHEHGQEYTYDQLRDIVSKKLRTRVNFNKLWKEYSTISEENLMEMIHAFFVVEEAQ